MLKILRFPLLIFIFLGCGHREAIYEPVLLEIPEESQPHIRLSELIEKYEIIPLELVNSPGLVLPDKGLIKDNFLFLGDKSNSKFLLVFDLIQKKESKSTFLLGESPDAFGEVTDFLVYGNKLMILDGLKRRVGIYSISSDGPVFEEFKSIDFSAHRFAFDGFNGYFLNAGHTETLFTITDINFKTIREIGKINAGHLLKPYNSFHRVEIANDPSILFHSAFNNLIFKADKGDIYPWKKLHFPDHNLDFDLDEIPIQTDFYEFLEKTKPFNSYFIIFEKSDEKSHFLVYTINEIPKVSIKSAELEINVPFYNIENDLTFEAQVPTVIGTYQDQYIGICSVEEINRLAPGFQESEVDHLLKNYPETEYLLLVFKFK